jgi:hypothetical protein
MNIPKIFLWLSAFLIMLPVSVFCQENVRSESRNAIYLEFLGQGILYSVNYDYMLSDHFSLRAGATIWEMEPPDFSMKPSSGDRQKEFGGFPIMINYLSGEKDRHLELGIGIVPTYLSKLVLHRYLISVISYYPGLDCPLVQRFNVLNKS